MGDHQTHHNRHAGLPDGSHQTAKARKPRASGRQAKGTRNQQLSSWDLLTDDIWAHIFSFLKVCDKKITQQTCRRFHAIFTSPPTKDTWGRLIFQPPQAVDNLQVWQLAEWLQQRSAGIIGISVNNSDLTRLHTSTWWHALVAATAGTGIRLRLHSPCAEMYNGLSGPAHGELVQRLTALHTTVINAADIAIVHRLAALRHLRLRLVPGSLYTELLRDSDDSDPDRRFRRPCQLSSLRTLQLDAVPPEAFFTPGTAAGLVRLQSLCLYNGSLEHLPAEVLQLPSLGRLELLSMLPNSLPDLSRLPSLRTLVLPDAPPLDNGTEAEAATVVLGGATGLTELRLYNSPIETREAADAIVRMPHLEELHLDYTSGDEAAFWAVSVQRQLHGRCNVHPAVVPSIADWVGDDW